MAQIRSGYIPIIDFRDDTSQVIDDHLIMPKVKDFFDARQITDHRRIYARECISPKDFKRVEIQYFYDVLFAHMIEVNDPLKYSAYAITFDKSLVTDKCNTTDIQFATINIGKVPVFYYIFIDLQEVFDFINLQTFDIKKV